MSIKSNFLFKAVFNAYNKALNRKWNKIYWAIDIHDTILKSTYSNELLSENLFYPGAKEFLKFLSSRPDSILILYSSLINEKEYLDFFESHDIYFSYVNKNPEVQNTEYANFNDKFYFNILLDDKAGFDGEKDWKLLREIITYFPSL
jgi:hypothetical protein